MEQLITKIIEEWFLTEPALFACYCTHTLAENKKMCVPMRSGKMRIEYNPDILRDWKTSKIEERLKYEVIRILLGHPYQRQPYKATKAALGLASDVTLADSYNKPDTIEIPKDLQYEKGKCFEEYYALVAAYLDREAESPPYDKEGMIDDGGGGASEDAQKPSNLDDQGEGDNHGSGGQNDDESKEDNTPKQDKNGDPFDGEDDNQEPDDQNGDDDGSGEDEQQEERAGNPREETEIERMAREEADSAELWEEDQLSHEQVKEVIARAQRSHQWGTLGGHLVDEIIASTIVKIDYRRILSMFRATVLASTRHRTRMLPSRRYGFEYMGSKRDFCTHLLVAVDVSGSVSTKQVSQALSIINRFFKYGVEEIEVIQFDAVLVGDPIPFDKAQKKLHIGGRGGTDFQPAIDFYCKGKYDGLIMITDGFAPVPTLPAPFRGNILWMIYQGYEQWQGCRDDCALEWINKLPRNRYAILPPVAE